MRRTDRLFDIIQILRDGKLHRAQDIADRLEVSVRTIYRDMDTLIASGVPILEALDICQHTAGNVVMEEALVSVRESISEGGTIAEPLGESGIFDDIVVNMIDVGEETGDMDTMLMKIADNYDEEVDTAVASLVSLLEPIMVIVLGGIVGTIVVAMFLPLISMIDGLQG